MPPRSRQKPATGPETPVQGELDLGVDVVAVDVASIVAGVREATEMRRLQSGRAAGESADPDYGADSRQRALMEGSGASPFLAAVRTGRAELPRVRVGDSAPSSDTTKPHGRPRYSHRGGRSYPERSGRDVAREIAEQAPGNGLTPAEQRETNARGMALVSAALSKASGEKPKAENNRTGQWSPKPEQKSSLISLLSDNRAGFIPRSDGELNLAAASVPFLRHGNGADVLGRHIIAERSRVERLLIRGGMTLEEASTHGGRRVSALYDRVDGYADDSLHQLEVLKNLQDALRGNGAELSASTTLMQLCGDRPALLVGAVSFAHRALIRRIVTEGTLPLNANPLRTVPGGFDQISTMITRGDFPKTKTGILARYIADWLQATTAVSVRDAVHRARLDEDRRRQFWARVQNAMPQDAQTGPQG